jgi:G3E family GTPase
VALVTGFLGSGKTTLLNRLLRDPRLADSAVLVNEFGAVGLDHLLIEPVDAETVLLPSGCVCCTVRAELRDALLDLWDRRQRRILPPFRRVVLETTGLADPAPIAQTLAADARLRHHYVLGRIATVVDGLTGADTLDAHGEAVAQAAVADLLLLSKVDLATPDGLGRLERRLTALNPAASLARLDPDDPATLDPVIHDLLAPPGGHAFTFKPSTTTGGHHGDIRAVCLTADEPLDWAAFALWFTLLLHRHGRDILRSKGILHLRGVATPVVVHGVQHVVHRPSHLPEWPDDGRPRTRLVLIGKGLSEERLARSFRLFMRQGQRTTAMAGPVMAKATT